jgi:hypothetical protein
MLMHFAEQAKCDGQAREAFFQMMIGVSELKEAIASVSRLIAFHPTQTLLISSQVDSVVCMG